MDIGERLKILAHSSEIPDSDYLRGLLDSVCDLLDTESPSIRPPDEDGLPGGLVFTATPRVLIVPDLHARVSFLPYLLGSSFPDTPGVSVASLLDSNRLALVCLGDILHSEGKSAAERWTKAAHAALRSGDVEGILSPEMDEEMGLSLRTLCMVMELKLSYPEHFHCLKGNHDNMSNSSTGGDLAFFKYAAEGSMGAAWFIQRYGTDLLSRMRKYELSLPLVAMGKRYCASHAEPAFPMTKTRIISSRSDRDVVRGLIWTGNDEALSGSTERTMLSLFGGKKPKKDWIWITGHRSVSGTYSLRAGNLLAQIHNPLLQQVAVVEDAAEVPESRAHIYTIQASEEFPCMSFAMSHAIGLLPA